MQKNRHHHARRIWQALAASIALMLFAGCEEVAITNLTPTTLPVNPSQIYTFSVRIEPKSRGFVDSSLDPRIVLDGQIYPMEESPLGPDIYEFDYQIPAGRSEVAYYYLVNYDVEFGGSVTPRESYTGVTSATLNARSVLSMVANRGPVGARIGVVGRGFTETDSVTLNGTPARTVFESGNSISFFVPAVAPGRNYEVVIQGPAGSQPVGTFRVDPVAITVTPAALDLNSGETQSLTFVLPQPAPVGGLLLDITTDVPESVIMPEVLVPAGSTSVSVPVRGGMPGVGSLYLAGFGADEEVIPLTVR